MAEAFLGLGGNIGDARAILAAAITQLCTAPDVRLLRRSADYRTAPWGVRDQPAFINACIAVETTLSPRDLLARALSVEATLGRDRGRERRWGPRPIDIDVLAYEDAAMNEFDLRLPHPRLLERAFVLVPLAEIAPDLVIAGQRVTDALKQVDVTGVERLACKRAADPG